MLINVLPDGNCGFNAIAVRLCDLSLTRKRDLSKLIPDKTLHLLMSELFDRTPSLERPEKPEDYFSSFLRQTSSWVDRQLLIAPILRWYTQSRYESRRQQFLPILESELLSEYNDFLHSQSKENLRFFSFIEEIFRKTHHNFPMIEEAKDQLRTWWQQKDGGFALYLEAIGKEGAWVDNDTLRLLAEELGFKEVSILRREQRKHPIQPQEMAIDWEDDHWFAHISTEFTLADLENYSRERRNFIVQRCAFQPSSVKTPPAPPVPRLATPFTPITVQEGNGQTAVVPLHLRDTQGLAYPKTPQQQIQSSLPSTLIPHKRASSSAPLGHAPLSVKKPRFSSSFVKRSTPFFPEPTSKPLSSFFSQTPRKIEELVHTAKQSLQARNPRLNMEELTRISENYKTLVEHPIEKFGHPDPANQQEPRTQIDPDKVLAENLQREEVEAFLKGIPKQ